jgi:hypothetical protein
MNARRALRGIRAPDELAARQRSWEVVHAAYVDRPPLAARAPRRRAAILVAAAVLVGVLVLALSPAGATVRRWISHTLGVPHSAPALFSLPTRGSMLVSGPGGTWTVAADGSARRLGPWRQASWSPRGRFVAVAGGDELAALDPHGTPRWKLARPAVSDARWYPPTGYRVAYLSGHELRVVAGDGTLDRVLAARVAAVAPSWRPGHPYELSYISGDGRVVARDADTGRVSWTVAPPAKPRELAWSTDGTRLLVVARAGAELYDQGGHRVPVITMPPGTPILDASPSPNGRMIALVRGGVAADVVLARLTGRRPFLHRVLSGAGLQQLTWSPDGRWLLVSWPVADQWVFVRIAGEPRIAAVSRIARQFATGAGGHFPHIDGWCCTAQGAAG